MGEGEGMGGEVVMGGGSVVGEVGVVGGSVVGEVGVGRDGWRGGDSRCSTIDAQVGHGMCSAIYAWLAVVDAARV